MIADGKRYNLHSSLINLSISMLKSRCEISTDCNQKNSTRRRRLLKGIIMKGRGGNWSFRSLTRLLKSNYSIYVPGTTTSCKVRIHELNSAQCLLFQLLLRAIGVACTSWILFSACSAAPPPPRGNVEHLQRYTRRRPVSYYYDAYSFQ